MKPYSYELEFITQTIKDAYNTCAEALLNTKTMHSTEALHDSTPFCMDKASFDIVTTLDLNIEEYVINRINETFPNDRILSEETMSDTIIETTGSSETSKATEPADTTRKITRTWTIDPIDGTFNMAAGMPLYGIQCALFENDETVVAAIYLPVLNELYYASKGCGAYLNEINIRTKFSSLDKSIVSFGDFPHSRPDDIRDERIIMNELYNHIARVRMFGAASIDFAFLASGKIQGTVIFTRNRWDIAPGILLCKEAGAIIIGDKGDYTPESRYIIAVADRQLAKIIPTNHPAK